MAFVFCAMLSGSSIHGHAADRINRLFAFMRRALVGMALVRVVGRRHGVTPVSARPAESPEWFNTRRKRMLDGLSRPMMPSETSLASEPIGTPPKTR
ncbi:hypothetical protein HMPREF0185_03439 [Brevundimonas diminuta 470-4]|nr:hypothetical protein HMPREF0185_03439 [Brevundimonas diminuta 470-4]